MYNILGEKIPDHARPEFDVELAKPIILRLLASTKPTLG